MGKFSRPRYDGMILSEATLFALHCTNQRTEFAHNGVFLRAGNAVRKGSTAGAFLAGRPLQPLLETGEACFQGFDSFGGLFHFLPRRPLV